MFNKHFLHFKKFVLKHYKIAIAFVLIILLLSFMELFLYLQKSKQIETDKTERIDNTQDLPLPKNLNFANEAVPFTIPNVYKAIQIELKKALQWKAQILLLHQRAKIWFPTIEPILKKNNIPDDFKYLAIIESQLTNVVSKQGAAGFWQLVEPTAKAYGLEITEQVDERFHVAKATQAACLYFKEAYKNFGNWTLVAASYNLGMAGIQNQISSQKKDTYYELNLNNETESFVYRILAVKDIMSRSNVYGIKIDKKKLFPEIEFKYLTIDSTINDLNSFALKQKQTLMALINFNPWILKEKLINTTHKKYVIRLPKNQFYKYSKEYEKEIIDSDSLTANKQLMYPRDTLIK